MNSMNVNKPVASNQEIFDAVAKHLLIQNKRSLTRSRSHSGETCAYRGKGGTKCALGCLIPDANYSPELEGYPVDNLAVVNALPFSLQPEGMELLGTLQALHDFVTPSSWYNELAKIAKKFNLQFNPPAQADSGAPQC